MKATVEIADELYRKVKAKSALEGRPVREVVAELFRGWVGEAERKAVQTKSTRSSGTPAPPWFGSLRKYAKNARGRHDMESIRASIVRGRAPEWAEKENLS